MTRPVCSGRVGAHVSIAGGLGKAVDRARDIGADCIQIFSGAPQQWVSPGHGTEEIAAFRASLGLAHIRPVVVHAKYLVNLATDDAFLLAKSVSSVIDDMRFAGDIGASGVVVHFGSHPLGWAGVKRQLYRRLIRQILRETPESVSFLLENSAGAGSAIGTSLPELAMIAADLPEFRIGFVLDTAHAYAAGWDLRSAAGVDAFAADIARSVGWDRVAAIHANDSKAACGSKRDRHDNIGEGQIGLPGFAALVNDPRISGKPFILETPGTDRKGPDRQNIARLRALVRGADQLPAGAGVGDGVGETATVKTNDVPDVGAEPEV